jgi:hypothetical protein
LNGFLALIRRLVHHDAILDVLNKLCWSQQNLCCKLVDPILSEDLIVSLPQWLVDSCCNDLAVFVNIERLDVLLKRNEVIELTHRRAVLDLALVDVRVLIEVFDFLKEKDLLLLHDEKAVEFFHVVW